VTLDPYATRANWRDPTDYRVPEVAAKSGGVAGNERLTAWTGAVLLLLLAVEGVTILKLSSLLTLHFFIGMLLVGPVVLKAGSTIYRFCRYYTGSAPYRRKGPPELYMRVLGPLVIASTAGVFGSGIALAFAGPGKGPWLFLHKSSFVLWLCLIFVHVMAHMARLPGLLAAEFRGGSGRHQAAAYLSGRGMRIGLLIASLAAGLLIAVLTVHLATPWHLARIGH
jgi:hypothetical protein